MATDVTTQVPSVEWHASAGKCCMPTLAKSPRGGMQQTICNVCEHGKPFSGANSSALGSGHNSCQLQVLFLRKTMADTVQERPYEGIASPSCVHDGFLRMAHAGSLRANCVSHTSRATLSKTMPVGAECN